MTPAPLAKLGPNEGAVSLLAWKGYADGEWVEPFERQTGCKVDVEYARTPEDMLEGVRGDADGHFDLVSASGDIALRLVSEGMVAEVNVALIPGWQEFWPAFRAPAVNTVGGRHYGISLQFVPNLLLYASASEARPTSWGVLYDKANAGQVALPDNPLQIAAAALYLARIRPSLGIRDPYALTSAQLAAVVALLKRQRPLVRLYWQTVAEHIDSFESRATTLAVGWPYEQAVLASRKVAVGAVAPKEGITGWLDTWMLMTRAKHPNCAYRWLRHVSTPKVQAQQAVQYGQTPVNARACSFMEKLSKGSCASYFANRPAAWYSGIHLWRTPGTRCPKRTACVGWEAWVEAWQSVVR